MEDHDIYYDCDDYEEVFEIEDDDWDDDRSCDYEDVDDTFYGTDLAREDWSPDPAETYSVDYYDEVLAAYQDARKQMNDMRLSRGFYPIVALVPTQPNSNSSRRKGTKKGKRSKGKNKSGERTFVRAKRRFTSDRTDAPWFSSTLWKREG